MSIEFYTKQLGFEMGDQWGSAFATVKRGDLTLWLAGPESSAARPMPDGCQPQPGGWNRLVIEVEDLAELVAKLKTFGVGFRNEIIKGPGGQQILVEDPSGNVVELFQSR
ncbi:MAG: VOC family protein [Chloroflexi bacterium]|nr:VOC family protein [Chloroflexota bacterium]